MKIPSAIRMFLKNQSKPSRYASNRNSSRPGIHVIAESRIASTESLPSTYSLRVNGRARYSGSPLLRMSAEISAGPTKNTSRKLKKPWIFMKRTGKMKSWTNFARSSGCRFGNSLSTETLCGMYIITAVASG
jgi:hypothetical protein